MDSVIETQRQAHEDIERYEIVLYSLLARNQPTHETKLQSEHKAAQVLSRLSARVAALKAQYEDEDARKAETDALTAPTQPGDLSEFYARLVKIQDHYHKYPDVAAGGFDPELAALLEEGNQDGLDDEEYEEEDPVGLLFSGEEAYGKYVDLYASHTAYNNLKNITKRLSYLQYFDVLLAAQLGKLHAELSRETLRTKEYESYIHSLHDYLLSFTKKTQPLVDVDSKHQEQELEFQKKWEAGEFGEDWDSRLPAKCGVDAAQNGDIWCSACQKGYSKQTVYDAHLSSKKHVKAIAKQATSNQPPQNPNGTPSSHSVNGATSHQGPRNAARWTYLASFLLVELASTIGDTKSNVERRFSLTAREREQELLERSQPIAPPANNAENGGGEEEEEEERIYNPLKLPLGWDGKPIPYWLYKLHGLGVEYKCEICSDHVYMGRKNFERHFQEPRHAFGMRALGLPNTKHFHEITHIEDALALAEKLKQEGRREIFEQETTEELEDDEGNVYNRKMYEDLKKQGLI
ncbi:hypothetical protein F5J12DRAFT_10531 [Pisolithus orientalis]|uniref:uncharacterized protein n=1 Tax=Pisolithus orientalis TaxID=936130 RepID=UPI00222489BA|nr:uncharacterized protein F5J12DRAFT_10531 [Pisolithus orientalis]KAI6035068.1 hypothetical protein F5J12DRAFT_10531 [Pisolithus orientalis]